MAIVKGKNILSRYLPAICLWLVFKEKKKHPSTTTPSPLIPSTLTPSIQKKTYELEFL